MNTNLIKYYTGYEKFALIPYIKTFEVDLVSSRLWFNEFIKGFFILQEIDIVHSVADGNTAILDPEPVRINDFYFFPELPYSQLDQGIYSLVRTKFEFNLILKEQFKIYGRTNYFFKNVKGIARILLINNDDDFTAGLTNNQIK